MTRSQLDELIALLRGNPEQDQSSSPAGPGGESDQEAHATNDSQPMSSAGSGGLLSGLSARFGSMSAGAKTIAIERDFWKSVLASVLPWAFALALAPIVVPWSFERDRAAAKPKISIEYAFLSRHSQEIPDDVAEKVTRWRGQPTYQAYRQYRLRTGPHLDIAAFMVPGARLGPKMYEDLKAEMVEFGKYLEIRNQELSDQMARLAAVPETELRAFAFDVLDDPSTLDEADPRSFLSQAIDAKTEALQQFEDGLQSLQQAVAESAPEIRVRLTLLNRGATDGLVRHHGQINYRGESYGIQRTGPPSADVDAVAVPVFQTNASAEDYSAGSVGKIEQDSMAEFWYSFSPSQGKDDANVADLCQPGELVEVTLYDQNRSEVHGTVECNQE